MKKTLSYLCIVTLLFVVLLAGCGKKDNNKDNPNYNSENYLTGTHYALMEVENFGKIYVALYADAAPATVTNFVNLVKEGFYDGLTFHRVVDNFMIQGGDPDGNGEGGATYAIPGEFEVNGFKNIISHERGTLSMARAEDYNSASSQFFITQQDVVALNGYYAAFGRVVSGIEIIDAICSNVPVEDSDGTVLPDNQPVIKSITMVSKEDVPSINVNADDVLRPEATTQISLSKVSDTEDLQTADRWIVNENGESYLLSSTEDLLSLGLYEIDLTKTISYGEENMLAYSSDIGAGDFILLQLNVTTDGYPNQLLVAEEHNGALQMYLLSYDHSNNTAFLIPFNY